MKETILRKVSRVVLHSGETRVEFRATGRFWGAIKTSIRPQN